METAYNYAQSGGGGGSGDTNQNAFSNIKIGDQTIKADKTTDTFEITGSNTAVTADTANKKITISVADGTTEKKGIVQLSDSPTDESTTKAATARSVAETY